MTKKLLTLADQEDVASHGMYMPHYLKLDLFKEAGKRQAAGELGQNLGPFSAAELIHEAIAEDLGFEIEKAPKKELTNEDLNKRVTLLLNRMPKKLRAAVEAASEKTGKSMNQIIVDAIEKKIRGT